MKTVLIVLAVGLAAALLLALYVRHAPTDAARWHVDPKTAERPGKGGWLVRPEGGDATAGVWDLPPAEVLARFDALVRAHPRTEVLAGSVAEGRITYVSRSDFWQFPDYTTVEAVAVPGGSSLAVLGRLRFGQSDLGVNRARIQGWIDRIPDT
ncbi:DUF1499 domain-containing protein [Rhodobacteraceae bacterium CCMM004]|nr:DUF1499 domain-containing protein [Rhodobacteraceae bacterium CCMM004]